MRCIRPRCLAVCTAAFLLLMGLSPEAQAVNAAPGDTVRLEIPFTEASYVGGAASVSNSSVLCDVSVSASGAFYGTAGGANLSVVYDDDIDGTVVVSARVRDDAPKGENCVLSFSGSAKASEYDARMIYGEISVSIPLPKPADKPKPLTRPAPASKVVPVVPDEPVEPDEQPDPAEQPDPTEQPNPAEQVQTVDPPEVETITPPEPQQSVPDDASDQSDAEPAEEDPPETIVVRNESGINVFFLLAILAVVIIAGGVSVAVILAVKRRREEREKDYTPLVEYDISDDA